MNQIFQMRPYLLTPRPVVDYSLKRPLIYLTTESYVEIYRLGFVKLEARIPITQVPTTMAVGQGLLSLSFKDTLELYKSDVKIGELALDLFPLCQIMRVYQNISDNLALRHDILLFDSQFHCVRIYADIHDFHGTLMLGSDDLDFDETELFPGMQNSFDAINFIECGDERFILYAGSFFCVFDAKVCKATRCFRVNKAEIEQISGPDEVHNQSDDDNIISIVKSSEHSNVAAVTTRSRTIFFNLNEGAARLKLLQLDYDFSLIRDALLTRDTFYAFLDDKCLVFNLKARSLANQLKLHNRHLGNELIRVVPITTTGHIHDDELAFLAVSQYHLQFYVNNMLKIERLIPGDIDYLFFRNKAVTKQFDWNLRFVSINKSSKRLIVTTQDQKQADTNFALERQDFAFSDMRGVELHQNTICGVLTVADDQFGFRFDLTSGEFKLFNAPGGRSQMSVIIAKIREDIGCQRELSFQQKNDMISDSLARNDYYQKYSVSMQNPDVVRSYSYNCGMIAMVQRSAVNCYYVQSGTQVFEDKLNFEPLCCYIDIVQNEVFATDLRFQADAVFETFLLCFDDIQFAIFDAVRGVKLFEHEFDPTVSALLSEAEHVQILDQMIVLTGYNRLSLIRPNISPSSAQFVILRDEPLSQCRIAAHHIVQSAGRLYFADGNRLLFFDVFSAAVFVLAEFDQHIRHFDVQDDLFAIVFADTPGVFFYSPEPGNIGRRVGGTQPQSEITANFQTKGEKMLQYLSINRDNIRKVLSKRKRHFTSAESKDFLKEEDVLFLSLDETVQLLSGADQFEQLGVLLLLGLFRSEMLRNESVYAFFTERADDLARLVSDYEGSYETCRSIVEDLM